MPPDRPATSIDELEDALEGRGDHDGDEGYDGDDTAATDSTTEDRTATETAQPEPTEDERAAETAKPAESGETEPADEPVATADGQRTYTLPDQPRFGAFAGKKVSEQELIAAGLLEKLIQSEHQDLHHMRKYNEEIVPLRQRLEELETKLKQPPPEEQPKADERKVQWTPELVEKTATQIEAAFVPQIERFSQMGGIEEEAVTLYPRLLSHWEYRFQSGSKLVETLTKGFAALAADYLERHGQEQGSQARSILETTMEELATKGVEDLNDPNVRESFGNWLAADKLFSQADVRMLDSRRMKAAFLAYLESEEGQKVARQPQAEQPRKANLAAGSRAGSSGGSRPKKSLSQLDKFVEEVERLEQQGR